MSTHDVADTSNLATEVAAAVVALIVTRTAAETATESPPALWRDRAAIMRRPLMPGRGAWRASAQPR